MPNLIIPNNFTLKKLFAYIVDSFVMGEVVLELFVLFKSLFQSL